MSGVKLLMLSFIFGVILHTGCSLSFKSFRMLKRYSTLIPNNRTLAVTDIKVRFYSNSTDEPATHFLRESVNILSDPGFDLKKPTVVYAHGYLELWDDESFQMITNAYVEAGTHNLLALDYSNLMFGMYTFAISHLTEISTEVSHALVEMLKQGLDLNSLHLVGHSMGVHVCGMVGRQMKAKGYRIKRITSLDAAYPLFYKLGALVPHLAITDAEFIDAIHTDGGGYGVPHSIGTADFYPNGGVAKQPGCEGGTIVFTPEDFCSHWRSYAFWAEAVRGGRFLAKKCETYDSFLRQTCTYPDVAEMGPQAGPGIRGNFYLVTGVVSPFALGEKGIWSQVH